MSHGDDQGPIRYIERTRNYYLGLGYPAPYRWAVNHDAPFAVPKAPVRTLKVAIVTTAALYDPAKGDQGPGARHNGLAKFFQVYGEPIEGRTDTRISHIAYDRVHTSATDPRSWFPLAALRAAAAEGLVGSLSPRFHGFPTDRSQRATLEVHAPALMRNLIEDGAEAVILVPNCPVCHQSLALAARHIEAQGLPTVVMGSAKDIVELAGAPRFLFSDFPLGNSAGRPDDEASQRETLKLALTLLDKAPGPRTTLASPLRWADDMAWKRDYGDTSRMSEAARAEARAAFDGVKVQAKAAKALA